MNLENRIDSFRAMQRRLQACCNHVSYAHSCVKLSLHDAINESSPELKEVVKNFARRVSHMQNAKEKWIQLFKSGAPKVLGDVFLACVGAIVMDSDHMQAENLLAKHCNDRRGVLDLLPLDMPTYKMLSLDEMRLTFDIFVQAAARSSVGKQLARWVPTKKGPDDEQGARTRFRLAVETKCNDICLLEVEQEGCDLLCSSPRAAVIGYSLKQRQDECHSSSEGSEPDFCASGEAGSPKAEVANKAQPEHDGAIYCRYCEMWLNGPTQWADHEIGKGHRKAVRRNQAVKQDCKLPKVPEGFGKKKQAVDGEHDAEEDADVKEDAKEDAEEDAEELVEKLPAEEDAEESDETARQCQEYSNTWTSPGGQEVFGYYFNPQTGEWVQGTMLMPVCEFPYWCGHQDYYPSEALFWLAHCCFNL